MSSKRQQNPFYPPIGGLCPPTDFCGPTRGGGITHREIERLRREFRRELRRFDQQVITEVSDVVRVAEVCAIGFPFDIAFIEETEPGAFVLLLDQPEGAEFPNGLFVVVNGAVKTLEPVEVEIGNLIYCEDICLMFIVTDTDPFSACQVGTQGTLLANGASTVNVDVFLTGQALIEELQLRTGVEFPFGFIFLAGQTNTNENGFWFSNPGADPEDDATLTQVPSLCLCLGLEVHVIEGFFAGQNIITINPELGFFHVKGNFDEEIGLAVFDNSTSGIVQFVGLTTPVDLDSPSAQILISQDGALHKLVLRSDAPALTSNLFAEFGAILIKRNFNGGGGDFTFSFDRAFLPNPALIGQVAMEIDLVARAIAAGLPSPLLNVVAGDLISIEINFEDPATMNVHATLEISSVIEVIL